MVCVMIHGVPETPVLWDALVNQLDLPADQLIIPAWPGFITPAPHGFTATKDSYVDWLINLLEAEFARSGPVDLVGHDWGAMLSLRVAHLRPDLIRTWAALNACVLPGERWHQVGRLWQTPIVGELGNLCARPWVMRRFLPKRGMPVALAEVLSSQIGPLMKRSILTLYRSAKSVDDEWGEDLSNLPKHGMLVWGALDPFMSLDKAERFCEKWDVPLHVSKNLGHWSLCEDPRSVADHLRRHWDHA